MTIEADIGAARHVAAQFLTESAALDTIGGVVGATSDILTVLAMAIAQDWTAIMPAWLPATAVLGTPIGLPVGAYPAWRAMRVEPRRSPAPVSPPRRTRGGAGESTCQK